MTTPNLSDMTAAVAAFTETLDTTDPADLTELWVALNNLHSKVTAALRTVEHRAATTITEPVTTAGWTFGWEDKTVTRTDVERFTADLGAVFAARATTPADAALVTAAVRAALLVYGQPASRTPRVREANAYGLDVTGYVKTRVEGRKFAVRPA